MRFGLLILAQGLVLAGLAAQLGGWGWVLAWPAVASVVVAVAYLADWTWIFGKRADGSLRWLPHLLLGPFLWATWVVWHLARRLGREPASHEVVPGLWLGRRPFLEELPPGCALVVDMTAEFPAHKAILAGVPTCASRPSTAPRPPPSSRPSSSASTTPPARSTSTAPPATGARRPWPPAS